MTFTVSVTINYMSLDQGIMAVAQPPFIKLFKEAPNGYIHSKTNQKVLNVYEHWLCYPLRSSTCFRYRLITSNCSTFLHCALNKFRRGQ